MTNSAPGRAIVKNLTRKLQEKPPHFCGGVVDDKSSMQPCTLSEYPYPLPLHQ